MNGTISASVPLAMVGVAASVNGNDKMPKKGEEKMHEKGDEK